jgi:hypothetical protein
MNETQPGGMFIAFKGEGRMRAVKWWPECRMAAF